jgi:hypothetical protein
MFGHPGTLRPMQHKDAIGLPRKTPWLLKETETDEMKLGSSVSLKTLGNVGHNGNSGPLNLSPQTMIFGKGSLSCAFVYGATLLSKIKSAIMRLSLMGKGEIIIDQSANRISRTPTGVQCE